MNYNPATKYLFVLLLMIVHQTLHAQKIGFSQAHGFFEATFELELHSNLENAEIRYTLDGSTPDPSSGIIYQNAIDILTTTIVRAIAYNDQDTSKVKTQTYLFLEDVLTQSGVPNGYPALWTDVLPGDYDMDPEIVEDANYAPHLIDALTQIPSISIVSDVPHLFDAETGIYTNSTEAGIEWERPTSIEMIYPDGQEGFTENAGLRMYGNSSREPAETPKHSFRLLFKDEYGPTKLDYPLFGSEATKKFDTFILRAGFNYSWLTDQDFYNQREGALYLRDMFARDVQLSMNHHGSHGRFVHLYLNGLYWGMYNIAERPDASFAAEYMGGEKTDYDVLNSGFEVGDSDRTAYEELLELATDFDLADDDNYQNVLNYLDLPNFIDYFILNHYIGNLNWDDHNWYAARKKEDISPWILFAWDSETSFFKHYINVVDALFEGYPTEIFQSLRNNEEFRLAFADRVHQQFFNCGTLTVDSVAARWDRLAGLIDQAIIGESARWGDYRRDVHVVNPAELYTKATWLAEKQRISDDFTYVRTDTVLNRYIHGNLYPELKAPIFSEPCDREVPEDFVLNIQNPNDNQGRIWLTTDGTDPRMSGGSIADTAIDGDDEYNLTINEVTTVKARILQNGTWSALQQTTFYPDVNLSEVLYFNEIMYNPIGGTADEFIEIKNASAIDIDLTGIQIIGGITYDFPNGLSIPANGFLILAEDSLAYSEKFNIPVFGQYSGKLSNSGETLILRSGTNSMVDEVTYQDTAPWNMDPDGKGTSLELQVDAADNSLADFWLASADIGGSPNAENRAKRSCGLSNPVPVINEINYNSSIDLDPGDWVELYNPSTEIFDLSDWQFQDEGGTYLFPEGSSIPAKGWLVLVEDLVKFAPVFPAVTNYLSNFPFGLSANGERLRLVSAAGCQIDSVRYNDQLPWPIEANGEGRTLQLMNPLDDNAIGENWTISTAPFGTPGDGLLLSVNLGPDVEVCSDTTIQFDLSNLNCNVCSYLWNDNNTDAIRSIEVTATTVFSVTVSNSTGESTTDEIVITVHPNPIISFTSEMISCFDAANGAINLEISNGSGDYNYLWNNGLTTSNLQNINAGNYQVTVSDEASCTAVETFVVNQPDEMTVEIVNMPVSCYGLTDGQIDLSVEGGSGSYDYLWNNGATTAELTDLIAGNYTVTISDEQECEIERSIDLSEPDEIFLPATVEHLDCAGAADGSINIHNGSVPYTFVWSNGENVEDLYQLTSGSYEVTITNANNCQKIQTYIINSPPAIELEATIVPTSCNVSDNGSISVEASGGMGAFSFLWEDNSDSPNREELTSGNYTLTITDDNNCSLVETFVVPEIEGLHLGASVLSISCNGQTDGSIQLEPNGGVGDYTFDWSNEASTEDLFDLVAGTYTVTVSDENNCSNEATFVIEEPNVLALDFTTSTIQCFGGNNGAINLSPQGGTSPYSFQWNTGSTNEDLTDLTSGTYSVTISDANNCTLMETYTLSEPTELKALSTSESISCFGGNNGAIDLSPEGGTTPYSFQWNTGSTSEDLSDLSAGTYSVTLSDANACTVVESLNLSEPLELATSAIIEAISCFGENDGSIDLTPIGGTPPYLLDWNTGSTMEDLVNLEAGIYQVSIEDAQQCLATATFEIEMATEITVTSEQNNITCFEFADGNIEVFPNGGAAPYELIWSNGATTSSLQDLSPGFYTLTLTDQQNCHLETIYEITSPNLLTIGTSITDPQNGNDGSITLFPDGGTPPYTINWNNGETGNLLEGLGAGQYSYQLTDANSCSISDSISLIVTSIEPIETIQKLSIYPNPSTGLFTLDCVFNQWQNAEIQLYNIIGQQLITQNLAGNSILVDLDLSAYADGVYFIHLKWGSEQSIVQKLMLAK